MPRKTYTAKILSLNNLTSDVVCLSIEKPKDYAYTAGQFAQFYIPDFINENKEVLRSYSIASSPDENDIKFYIKLVPNGKTGEYMKNSQIGEDIKFGDPVGRFVNTDAMNPLYFIATGVGIAPIISIIKDELINKKNTNPLHLTFGLRLEKDIFLTDTLDNLKKTYKNFAYKLTLSQPSPEWKGSKGRVTNHLPEKVEQNSQYFICGNMPMITDVSHFLETQGLAKTNIHFEVF